MIRDSLIASLCGYDRKDKRLRHRSARRRAFLPGPEALEGRVVLSTLNVTNNLDSGPGSLRQAVLDANSATGPDTILFAGSVHKITLTGGELAITDDLEVAGPGESAVDDQRQ